MAAVHSRCGHYIFVLWFLFFFLLFFHRWVSVITDWMSTILPHVMWKDGMSEVCCTQLTENTGCKESPSGHHRTTLSSCIFVTKACICNRKKLLNSNISSTHPYNMANFDHSATNGWDWFRNAEFGAYFLCSCSLPNFISILSPITIQFVMATLWYRAGHYIFVL